MTEVMLRPKYSRIDRGPLIRGEPLKWNHKTILAIVEAQPGIHHRELSRRFGGSLSRIDRPVHDLLRAGLLVHRHQHVRTGPGRNIANCYWLNNGTAPPQDPATANVHWRTHKCPNAYT